MNSRSKFALHVVTEYWRTTAMPWTAYRKDLGNTLFSGTNPDDLQLILFTNSILFIVILLSANYVGFCLSFADVGFSVPDHFLVGYALDYNEYFRDLSVCFTMFVHT